MDSYEKLLQLKDERGGKAVSCEVEPGQIEHLDLSKLSLNKNDLDYWKGVDELIDKYQKSKLASDRVRYVSLKETQPEEAKLFAEKMLRGRLKHAMILADGFATAKFSESFGNVVRIELRRKFENLYELFIKELEDGTKTIEDIDRYFDEREKDIISVSADKVYENAEPHKFISAKHEGKSYYVPVDKKGKFVNPNSPEYNKFKAVLINPNYNSNRAMAIDDPATELWRALKNKEKPNFRRSQEVADNWIKGAEEFYNEKYGTSSCKDAVTSLFERA
jgi:hypothetical protein